MELASSTDLDADLPSVGFIHDRERRGYGVEHVNAVTDMATCLAKSLIRAHRMTIDLDVVIAGALLHDVGKLLEHASGGSTHPLADPMVSHAFSGVHIGVQAGLPKEVLHVIAYHAFEGHRRRRSHECEIVYRADMISVDALSRRELGRPGAEMIKYVYLP